MNPKEDKAINRHSRVQVLKTKDKGKILKRIGKGEKGSYTFILPAIQWLADSQEEQWTPETMEQYLNGLKHNLEKYLSAMTMK